MKHLKKLGSVLLALVMVLALAAPAFATGVDSAITATGLDGNDTVTYYRVVKWDETAKDWVMAEGFTNVLVDGKPLTVPDLQKGITEAMATAIAEAAKTAQPIDTTQAVNGTWTATGVAAGLYYLKATPTKDTTIYNPAFVSADYHDNNSNTVSFSDTIGESAVMKKSDVTLTKTAGTDLTDSDKRDVAVGDSIPFTVTTTIPTYGSTFDPDKIQFSLTDTLSVGLVLDGEITVKYTDKKGDHKVTATQDPVTITKNDAVSGQNGGGYTVSFSKDYLLNASRGEVSVTIIYSAKVTEEAKTNNVNPMDNTVKLTYSHTPDETTPEEKEVITRHYSFTIGGTIFGTQDTQASELIKVGLNADNTPIVAEKPVENAKGETITNPLAGAKFELYKSETVFDETTKVGECTTLADGRIKFEGLDAGTYTMKETEAPDGFVAGATYKVEIIPTYSPTAPTDELLSYVIKINGEVTSTFTKTEQGETITYGPGTGTTTIENKKSTELPSTGGIGTTIFYIVGGVLVLGAVVLLITRRRTSVDDE